MDYSYPTTARLFGVFYEANIPVDIIWSHGWMAEHKITAFKEFSQLGIRKGREMQFPPPLFSCDDRPAESDFTKLDLVGAVTYVSK